MLFSHAQESWKWFFLSKFEFLLYRNMEFRNFNKVSTKIQSNFTVNQWNYYWLQQSNMLYQFIYYSKLNYIFLQRFSLTTNGVIITVRLQIFLEYNFHEKHALLINDEVLARIKWIKWIIPDGIEMNIYNLTRRLAVSDCYREFNNGNSSRWWL